MESDPVTLDLSNQNDIDPSLPIPIIAHIYHTAIVAIFFWDYLITLPTEIRLLWTKEMSLMKVFYFANRYITFIFSIIFIAATYSVWDYDSCKRFAYFEPECSAIIVLFAQSILIVRTYALWWGNKKILALLLILYIIEAGVMFSAAAHVQPNRHTQKFVGCIAIPTSPYYAVFYIASLVFDFAIFALTLSRTIILSRRGKSRLLRLLQHDGILYYTVVFLINALNTAFNLQPNESISALNAPAATLITSIMASRIVLSLKSFATDDSLKIGGKESNSGKYLSRQQQQMRRTRFSFGGKSSLPDRRPMSTADMQIGMTVTTDAYISDIIPALRQNHFYRHSAIDIRQQRNSYRPYLPQMVSQDSEIGIASQDFEKA